MDEADVQERVIRDARAPLVLLNPARAHRAIYLLGGDKAGNWQRWYRENIPVAEQLYLDYTTG